MQAIRIHEYGGPDMLRLEDVLQPVPAADEILVKVYASGVNPVDWGIREGAKEKLSVTTLTVSEIAYQLGFEHLQSFSKLFKTKTGLSPLEFRASFT